MKYGSSTLSEPRPMDFGETRLFRNPVTRGSGLIYFLQPGEIRKVKIGFSNGNLHARITTLQIGCPERFVFLGALSDVSRKMETLLHRRFKAERLHGEWFTLSERVLDFIARRTKRDTWDANRNWLGIATTPALRKHLKGRG